MTGTRRILATAIASLSLTGAAGAAEPGEPVADRAFQWSMTLFGQAHAIASPQDDDDVGGFFDQYDFTPNKGSTLPFELGIRDASFDWIEDDAALLQLRFESPTSNLGISGTSVDDPFFNQRALILGRLRGWSLDFEYRRMRTEQLRRFPNTSGSGLPFSDLTDPGDRFFRDRTGFAGELRWRPEATPDTAMAFLSPVISLRGGFEGRDESKQQRMLLEPGNDWLAATKGSEDEVSDVGAGVLLSPDGRFQLALDYDFQRYASADPVTDDALPFASTSRTVGFTPSTDRSTGGFRLRSRIGERSVVTAAFQASVLEQVDPLTPAEVSSHFGENKVTVYSASLTGDVNVSSRVSARAFFKLDYREHDLDRSTSLFNPVNGSQVAPFLQAFTRTNFGAEAVYRPRGTTRLSLGARFLRIDRNLDFATVGLGNQIIQPENALIGDRTFTWEIYGRARIRPLRALGIRAELAYRGAPETGYIVDLDRYVHGRLRASWFVPSERPLTLSLFARGGTGENRNFQMLAGLAPNPPGPSVDRDYQQSHWNIGLSVDTAIHARATVFGSIFASADDRDEDLLLSDLQRTFQETVPLSFRTPGELSLANDEVGLMIGTRLDLDETTGATLSYAFTRATSDYADSDSARELDLVDANRRIDANVHTFGIEFGHDLRPGLRVLLGYRLQHYKDAAPIPTSEGGGVTPFDRDDTRHTVTFGLSLDNALFAPPS